MSGWRPPVTTGPGDPDADAVVLRVVCAACGDAEIGWAVRGEARFEFRPKFTALGRDPEFQPDVWTDYWPLDGWAVGEIVIPCNHHGARLVNRNDAVSAARRGRPGRPATYRAGSTTGPRQSDTMVTN